MSARAVAPAVRTLEPSRYLDYLPGVFREDEFMGRFLLIFEGVLDPIEQVVDSLPLYFDPLLCPEELLPYLAHWVDTALNERHPLERRRRLVKAAAELYRWRGTRRGRRAYLQAVTGVYPLIVENTSGIRLGSECWLGLNSRLGAPVAHCVSVTLPVDDASQLNRDEISALLEAEIPAHAVYQLFIVPRQRRPVLGGDARGAELPEQAAT